LSAGTLGLRSKSTVADTELARERLAEATALARGLGEPLPLLRALSQVTLALPITGELEPARLAAKEGLELARAIGHARWRGRFETWLGMVCHASGEMVEGARWGQLGLRRALRAGDPRGVIAAGLLLHPLPPEAGVDRAALPSLDELTAMARRLGDVTIQTHLYAQLAAAALATGDHGGSARWVLARLELVVRSGAWHGPGYVLMQSAMIACLRGDDQFAARLHGPVSPMLDVLQGGLPPPYAARYRACIAAARKRVGTEMFEALVADASPQPWHEALAVAKRYLLSVAEPRPLTSQPVHAHPDPTRELTAREQQVLAHLVAGRRNKEIAALLAITPKTVMHHSVAIYRKLGVRGRAEAAVLAVREGLVPEV
jgi:DNA-binding CsgD family transcriptional regulator